MTKQKRKILKVIRKSVLTGKAVWAYHKLCSKPEYMAYRTACDKEINIMRQWGNIANRRRKNIMHMLHKLTANLPLLGDIGQEKREAAKMLMNMADKEPPKKSDFYDHIQEEKRQRRNAKKRLKRWQEKYGIKK